MNNRFNTTDEQEAQYQADIWRCLMTSIRCNPANGNRFIARRMQDWLPKQDRDPHRVKIAEKAIQDIVSWIVENPEAGMQLLDRWQNIQPSFMNGREDTNYASHIRKLAQQAWTKRLAFAGGRVVG